MIAEASGSLDPPSERRIAVILIEQAKGEFATIHYTRFGLDIRQSLLLMKSPH